MSLNKLNLFLLFLVSSVVTYGQEKPELSIGGAVRFNLLSEFYNKEGGAKPTDTKFTFDTWRLNTKASYKNLGLDFEYRFYPTFGTHFAKQGFLFYSGENSSTRYELGITQVPFGNLTYASHSWWFQNPYYVGLEDDHDMGLKMTAKPNDRSQLDVAYFRQSEPEGPVYGGDVTFANSGAGRYSYDLVPTENQHNRELNQLNVRYSQQIDKNKSQLGASVQIGQTYNSVLEDSEASMAFAIHSDLNLDNNWNIKPEIVYYNYGAKNDLGQDLEVVNMGAYGFSYGVASEATMYVIGASKSFDIENAGPISAIQAYIDYTYTDKANKDFFDTQQLVPGMMITAGNLYTYVDAAMGKNQPWLTSNFGTGQGAGVEDAKWNTRLNINLGYYFSKQIQ